MSHRTADASNLEAVLPGEGEENVKKMDGEIFVTRFKVIITFRVPLPRTGTRQQAHLYSGRALLR